MNKTPNVYPDDVRYRAIRHYKDARHYSFDQEQDFHVDSWLDWLKEHAPTDFEKLITPNKK